MLDAMPGIEAVYLELAFSKSISDFRKGRGSKAVELLRVLGRLCKIRATGKIDAIIFPSGGPHLAPLLRDMVLVPACRLACPRVIMHFHAAGIARGLPTLPAWLSRVIKAVYSSCCASAISITNFGQEDPQSLGIHSIAIIPNGIEDENPQDTIYPLENNGPIRFLSVGHICADKGTPELLRAFSEIARMHPSAELTLVGECLSPYTPEKLRQDIEGNGLAGRVTLAGLKTGSDLYDEYREAAVFVFPSVAPYESFGMVLIEAMMFGLPLVVTDWRANREVVTENFGGIAYQPSPNHSKALEDALDQMIEARLNWEEWGQKNRSIFQERYTLHVMSGNFGCLLRAA